MLRVCVSSRLIGGFVVGGRHWKTARSNKSKLQRTVNATLTRDDRRLLQSPNPLRSLALQSENLANLSDCLAA